MSMTKRDPEREKVALLHFLFIILDCGCFMSTGAWALGVGVRASDTFTGAPSSVLYGCLEFLSGLRLRARGSPQCDIAPALP